MMNCSVSRRGHVKVQPDQVELDGRDGGVLDSEAAKLTITLRGMTVAEIEQRALAFTGR